MAERGIPSYENNSFMARKEREHKVEKVVKGEVSRKKKTPIQKMASDFIETDGLAVSSWLWDEVIKPRAKDVTMDILETIGLGIMDSVSMMLFGETSRKTKSRNYYGRTSYRQYYDRPSKSDKERERERSHSRIYVDEIEMESYADARAVVDELLEILDINGEVSVADYYDACGEKYEYTDSDYGWTNLRSIDVKQIRGGGWVITLPKPKYLK